jgi:CspA family cold shock protein
VWRLLRVTFRFPKPGSCQRPHLTLYKPPFEAAPSQFIPSAVTGKQNKPGARGTEYAFQKSLLRRPPRAWGALRTSVFQEKAVMATTGQVKFFNSAKGFGFIAPEGGGKDVFVHVSAVEAAGLRSLNEGQRITFDVEADKRGPKAVNLKLA